MQTMLRHYKDECRCMRGTGGLEEGKMAHRDSHGPREGHVLVRVRCKVFPQALTIGRLEGHRAASEAGCKVLPGCD